MVGWSLDDEFDWLQAGWSKISSNPQLCVLCTGSVVVFLSYTLQQERQEAPRADCHIWCGLEPSLCWTAFTDHSGTHLNQETWTGVSISQRVHFRSPLAQNWPQSHNLILFFSLLKKSLNSQMLEGLFPCILAN